MKGFIIGSVLMVLNQWTGSIVIISYAATVFEASGSSFDPQLSTVIFGSIELFGAVVAAITMDRVGRKALLLMSLSGMCCGLIATGTFTYLITIGKSLLYCQWIPVIGMSTTIFFYAIGMEPVPFILLAEVLPKNVNFKIEPMQSSH